MTFEELLEFIEHRMSMSHIYQPLLIRSLVEAGGVATLRQLAQAFVAQDESQILFYEQRIKQMPVKILANHGIVRRDGQFITLTTQPLTYEQRIQIRAQCDARLGRYLSRRGFSLWDYRMLAEFVPDNLRYLVLKNAGGRCARSWRASCKTRPKIRSGVPSRSSCASAMSPYWRVAEY